MSAPSPVSTSDSTVESTSDATDEPTIDVLGIGNALVDILSTETDATLERLSMIKGTMDLVDEARMAEVYAAMGPGTEVSGGSAANTMVGVASMGGSAHYIGRVADDALGVVFAHDLRAAGVGYSTEPVSDGPATGCCLVLITEDGERTMNTFLGSSSLLDQSAVDESLIARSKVVFLEGYLFDRPEAQEAFRLAAELAHRHGAEVALTLSDLFCVERHRHAFCDLVDGHVDILFANDTELTALYETDDIDAAVSRLASVCSLAAVTLGEEGSLVLVDGDIAKVAAERGVEVVDTTGAGDLFAAGFLAGRVRGLDPEICGRLGSIAAAEVISHIGPRPLVRLADLAVGVLGH